VMNSNASDQTPLSVTEQERRLAEVYRLLLSLHTSTERIHSTSQTAGDNSELLDHEADDVIIVTNEQPVEDPQTSTE
jgi:hypothetical protein